MRPIGKILALLLTLTMLTVMTATLSAAEAEKGANRFNIVFVNDESGSMTYNDSEKYRYEAIRRFIALMAQEGNYLGSVSFNDRIINTSSISPIRGFDEKKDYVEHVSKFAPQINSGTTDIGLALKTAVDLLDAGRDKELRSIIILLTDGKTDVPKERVEASATDFAESIERCAKAGYTIYTIGLGDDTDKNALLPASLGTGGMHATVSDSRDLDEVQTMFYRIIFGAETGPEYDVVIGKDGKAERSFDVPGIGVEELNVIIEGKISGCTLKDPNGKVYGGSEIDSITVIGRDFRLVKVVDPVGGKWTATAYGDEGAEIRFKPLYNSSFYIETTVEGADDLKLGDTLTFGAAVCDSDGRVNEPMRYVGFEAELRVEHLGKTEKYDMQLTTGGYKLDYTIETEGTYYISMSVRRGDKLVESDKYEFSVNNLPPVPPEKQPEVTTYIWPIFGGSGSIDLTRTATDPDGVRLDFGIVRTAFPSEDYTLDGSRLTVGYDTIGSGSFTVRATDVGGAYCEYDVYFRSVNLGWIAIGIVLFTFILLVVIGYLTARRLAGYTFGSDVTVTLRRGCTADGSSTLYVGVDLGRGSVPIEHWCAVDTSECLPAGTVIQAGAPGDNCIYLITKKPVCCDDYPDRMQKKHRIPAGSQAVFRKDGDSEVGVQICCD